MKRRTGFVSNSSSSSFVLTFKKKPESVEDVAEALGDVGFTNFDHSYTSDEVHQFIWNRISKSDQESAEPWESWYSKESMVDNIFNSLSYSGDFKNLVFDRVFNDPNTSNEIKTKITEILDIIAEKFSQQPSTGWNCDIVLSDDCGRMEADIYYSADLVFENIEFEDCGRM